MRQGFDTKDGLLGGLGLNKVQRPQPRSQNNPNNTWERGCNSQERNPKTIILLRIKPFKSPCQNLPLPSPTDKRSPTEIFQSPIKSSVANLKPQKGLRTFSSLIYLSTPIPTPPPPPPATLHSFPSPRSSYRESCSRLRHLKFMFGKLSAFFLIFSTALLKRRSVRCTASCG